MRRLHKQLIGLALILFCLSSFASPKINSQNKFDLGANKPIPPTPPTGQEKSSGFMEFRPPPFPTVPGKQGFDFRPPSNTPVAPSESKELRYLYLGSIDLDLSLIIRLTDKAKERRLDPLTFIKHLRSQQTAATDTLSLNQRIDQLIIEFCIYDLGATDKNEFQEYLQKIKIQVHPISQEEETFNYLVVLSENQLLSPMEAIDCLFLLKQKINSQ